ncbi:MAG: hypothetical protein AAF585_19865, partial [Verrucomicrobiota bacterium]
LLRLSYSKPARSSFVRSDLIAKSGRPKSLQEIIDFFEPLPEAERRDALMIYAESVSQHVPKDGENFAVNQSRKDEHCLDEVGVFLETSADGAVQLRVQLGDKVQTLTRALTSILCKGLNGAKPETIRNLPNEFIPRIVGEELMRQRSRTVYYVLDRLREAALQL